MICVDGSVLEGGGQIVRIALSIASVLFKTIKISNIRAGRLKPGLAAQHLEGIHLLNSISNGTIQGDFLGSATIEYFPGHGCTENNFISDAGTAGSVTLMAQIALPAAVLLRPKGSSPNTLDYNLRHIKLRGGTNVPFSPPIDHSKNVLIPFLEKFGIRISAQILKRGYYPRGQGIAQFRVFRCTKLFPIDCRRQGSLISLNASVFGNVSPSVITSLEISLKQNFSLSPLITIECGSSISELELKSGLDDEAKLKYISSDVEQTKSSNSSDKISICKYCHTTMVFTAAEEEKFLSSRYQKPSYCKSCQALRKVRSQKRAAGDYSYFFVRTTTFEVASLLYRCC